MLLKYLYQAYRGKWIWERIRRKYGSGYAPSRYLLFPSSDDEYNAWGLYYLDYYLQKNHYDKVIVLTKEVELSKALRNIHHNNLHIIQLNEEQMNCIIRLNALVNLGAQCTIVSVKEPYDTGAERLLGKKGVTKRELVWYDIYRMSKQPETAPVVYMSQWKEAEKYANYIKIGE